MLRAQNLERTSLTGTFPAGPRSEPQPRVFVWDTGQQRSGWATVSISGAAAGTPIQIRYAEKLAANGLVSITGYAPAGQIQTDYYIAKGTGTETFTPRFTYKGFQYVQISAVGGGALPDGITATVDSVQEIREPMQPTGSFDTSSDLIDLISRNIHSSIAENYVSGVITDTPTYEKNGWAGDAQLSVGARLAVLRHRAPLRQVLPGHGRRPAPQRRGHAALAGHGQLRLRERPGVQAGQRQGDRRSGTPTGS